MIQIIFNHPEFEYDVYGLVQAFFPREELETVYDVPEEERQNLPYQSRNRVVGTPAVKCKARPAQADTEGMRTLAVSYRPGQIVLTWTGHEAVQESCRSSESCPTSSNISGTEKTEQDIHSADSTRTTNVISLPPTWPANPAHDPAVRPEMKNLLKRGVYDLLSELTGKTLPWGTLTGIRPTKVPFRMMEEGASDAEIRQFMETEYETSDEKIRTATAIAHREHAVLSSMDAENGYSIYIGIPFCPTTCLYCSFPSYARASYAGQVQQYLKALEKEIHAVRKMMEETGKHLDTVYIGGGTPTSLSAEELEELFSVMDRELPMELIREFTVEAGRPDSITTEKLRVMRAHRVSRISINPQTMHDRTLRLIGRHHTAAQLREAFALARAEGFTDINMDLILGLPGETMEDVAETLAEVAAMGPDNLTIHSLAIKSKSRLNHEWASYQQYAMENSDRLMQMAYETAENMGLQPYYLYRQKHMVGNLENVGFAKPGLEGLYNILIMEERESILALGAGTASKYVSDGGRSVKRTENVRDVPTYIERIDEMIARKQRAVEKHLLQNHKQ